jgi:hypothetical protein
VVWSSAQSIEVYSKTSVSESQKQHDRSESKSREYVSECREGVLLPGMQHVDIPSAIL